MIPFQLSSYVLLFQTLAVAPMRAISLISQAIWQKLVSIQLCCSLHILTTVEYAKRIRSQLKGLCCSCSDNENGISEYCVNAGVKQYSIHTQMFTTHCTCIYSGKHTNENTKIVLVYYWCTIGVLSCKVLWDLYLLYFDQNHVPIINVQQTKHHLIQSWHSCHNHATKELLTCKINKAHQKC